MSNADKHEAIEREIRRHFDAGDLQSAATVAIEGYGPEILGMLHSLIRDDEQASEAFSIFTEDLWNGLEGFRWGSSFRTWAFRLAHNARYREHRGPARRIAKNAVPLSDSGAVGALVERVRTQTLMHLKTSVKDRVSAMRQRLSADEQTLLILRVDKKMSWSDVARVMLDQDEPSRAEIKKKSNALRQQFHKLKEKLREMAKAEGLLPG